VHSTSRADVRFLITTFFLFLLPFSLFTFHSLAPPSSPQPHKHLVSLLHATPIFIVLLSLPLTIPYRWNGPKGWKHYAFGIYYLLGEFQSDTNIILLHKGKACFTTSCAQPAVQGSALLRKLRSCVNYCCGMARTIIQRVLGWLLQ